MYQNIYYDNYKKKVHIWDDRKGHVVLPYKHYAYIKDRNGRDVSLYGDRLKKIYKWEKHQTGLYESDVNPEMRTLVDTYTDSDDMSEGHRVMFFDIEVEVTKGFPLPSKAENKITSIALYDEIMDKYYCYVLDESLSLDVDFGENITVEAFSSEPELLNRFFVKYREIQPTILSGWNSNNFDIPYLYNRASQILGQDVANCLSHIDQVHYSNYRQQFGIAGVSCLDYLALYKRFTFSQKSSYRLDEIANDELGIKKVSYEGTLNDLYENDLRRFVEYNIHDVRLVKKLNDKLDFIDIARGICHLGHVPYEDIHMSSRYLEGAILVYLKKLGIVAPNKDPRGKELIKKDEKFIGAYVQDPQRGRYEWVYDLDITSMYPSTIMSLNISPETKVGKVDGGDAREFVTGINKTYNLANKNAKEVKLSDKKLKEYLDNNNVSISTNGVIYRNNKKGLIPSLLSSWFDKRNEYRKLMKKFADEDNMEKYQYFNRMQYIQKVVLNSLYGVLGLPVFRFYDLDNAEAVTTTGQELIKYTKVIGNHFYNNELGDDKDYCIYIDTDSVFFSALPIIEKRFPNQKLSDVMMTQRISEIASEVQSFINRMYGQFSKRFCNLDNHRFEIKQEIIARSGLFIVKKRYGMKIISDNGVKVNKILMKGIDTVRSNFPTALRLILKEVLEDILSDVPKEKIDERILNFKDKMKTMDIDEIATPTTVKGMSKYLQADEQNTSMFSRYYKGTPVHVKAALAYNDLLKHFKRDKKYSKIENISKIKWVYLKKNQYGLETLAYKGHEDPIEILSFIRESVNYDKIYSKSLKKKITMFYDTMDWGEPTDASKTIERFF